MQSVLRTDKPAYPGYWNETKGLAHIANLKDAFDKSSLDKDTKVYRGVRVVAGGDKTLLNLKVGDVFEDKGVMSTSTDKKIVADKFSTPLDRSDKIVRMEIDLPKGAKAIDVGQVTGKRHEKEIALAPGSKLQVVGRSEKAGVVTLK